MTVPNTRGCWARLILRKHEGAQRHDMMEVLPGVIFGQANSSVSMIDFQNFCVQEAEVAPAEGMASIEEQQGAAAQQSTSSAIMDLDADFDIMKLLPSTLGDPTTAADAATEVLPLDKEVGAYLLLHQS